MNNDDVPEWLHALYAICTCSRSTVLCPGEIASLLGASSTNVDLCHLDPEDVERQLPRVAALRAAHPEAPLSAIAGYQPLNPRGLLETACRLVLSEGSGTPEQHIALDALRAAFDLEPEVLEAMVDERLVERIPSFPSAEDLGALRAVEPELAPDPEVWKSLDERLRRKVLDVARFYRSLGFFAPQSSWSDQELASALYAYHAANTFDPEPRSEWGYLAADRARVWTVDFTGTGDGPSHDLEAAVRHLSRISAGAFAPTAVSQRSTPRGPRLIVELGDSTIELGDLIESPLQFDLMLLEKLGEASPKLSFCCGFDDDVDAHHFIVVERKVLPDLLERSLGLFGPDDFRDFREWAQNYGP